MEVAMRMVAVFHGQKVEGLVSKPAEVAVNPTLTVAGMERIHKLAESLRPYAPFAACYSSRMARALDTASVLCLAFDLELATIRNLGQHANKDGDSVIFYPGREHEDFVIWQWQALSAFYEIANQESKIPCDSTVLVVSHRPILAGIVAAIKGIKDEQGIKEITNDSEFAAKQFLVFKTEGTKINFD